MARQERSAGFISFHVPQDTTSGEPTPVHFDGAAAHYLLLDHGRHWSFPKGHVEAGEDELTAALRELREETGISSAEVFPRFRHEIHYYFRHRARGLVCKSVTYFLARVPTRKIILSSEHVAAEFVAFERAIKQVTFASDREVLRQAHAHLGTHVTPQSKRTPT